MYAGSDSAVFHLLRHQSQHLKVMLSNPQQNGVVSLLQCTGE